MSQTFQHKLKTRNESLQFKSAQDNIKIFFLALNSLFHLIANYNS